MWRSFLTNVEALESRSRSLWMQKPLEGETLNFRALIDCLNQENFKKVKGSAIVKCAQKNYFSYIIDKLVSLRRNFSKALAILLWFLLLFFLLFLLIIYVNLPFHLEVFQRELYCISIVWIYEYLVNPWYFNIKCK